MKMESDNVKSTISSATGLSTTTSSKLDTDSGKLTFGPAWLRQLSSGDANKTQLPPSPGYQFQLSKHRYSREDMLTIFETIENSLLLPKGLEEFEELIKREIQKPILLTQPSLEEEKSLSTCVNSLAVLNQYNKTQGSSITPSNTRGGSNGSRGSRGGGGGSSSSGGGGSHNVNKVTNQVNERGGGSSRGRGRPRGNDSTSLSKLDEENLNTNNSTNHNSNNNTHQSNNIGRGGGKGPYQKSNYPRSHNSNSTSNWEERENVVPNKKEYHQRSSNESSWRKTSTEHDKNDKDSNNTLSNEKFNENNNSNNTSSNNNNNNNNNNSNSSINKTVESNINNENPIRNSEWKSSGSERNNKEWSKTKYNSDQNRKIINDRRNNEEPEWLNDDDEEVGNAFDESGKFIKKENKKPKSLSPKQKEEKTQTKSDANQPTVSQSVIKQVESTSISTTSTTTSTTNVNVSQNTTTSSTVNSTSQKNEGEIEKAKIINSEIITNNIKPAEVCPTIKDNFNHDNNNNNLNNNDNKNMIINNVNENVLTTDQVLLNSLLNTSATKQQLQQIPILEPQQPSTMLKNDNLTFNPLGSNISHLIQTQLLNTTNPSQIQQSVTPGNIPAHILQGLLQQHNLKAENNDPKKGAVPLNHPDADKWLYLDPQNQIQGTFTSEEMAAWFAAGYFNLTLMIRRGCDDQFLPLGVVAKNWGRLPFLQGTQPPPILKPKEQMTLQMYQQMQQQLQLQFPQTTFRNDVVQSNIESNLLLKEQISPIHNLLPHQQQPQQNLHDPLVQQEYLNRLLMNKANIKQQATLQALIQQQQQQQQIPQVSDLTIDPAIVSAAPSTKSSIWGDISANKVNPINTLVNLSNTTSTVSAKRDETLNVPNSQLLNFVSTTNAQQLQNDKIQAFFEQTKKDEEKRRKQEEHNLRLKMIREEEEARRKLEEIKIKEEEEFLKKRLLEEERLRKEEQMRRLQEIIRKDEEDQIKRSDEKRKKDEENRQKLENLKKRDELKRLEIEKLEKLKQQEEEKKRLLEKQQQQELIKKQLEKQKLQQQELTNLQLPAHANWAKLQTTNTNFTNQNVIPLKSILEQQTIESMEKQRQLMEQQQKQAELQVQNQNSWSSLFRGGKQQPPSLLDIQNEQAQIELAKQQQEQLLNKPKQTPMSSLLSKPNQPTTWAAWGNTNANNVQSETVNSNFPLPSSSSSSSTTVASTSTTNTTTTTTTALSTSANSNTGFWNAPVETKKPQNTTTNKNIRNQNQGPPQSTKQSKNVDIQEVAQKLFKKNNFQISDEFMKWCHEQLKEFKAVDLHIPTFVNFLSEIQTCEEIEEYVCNYLGETHQAREFAQHFYLNRENQFVQKKSKETIREQQQQQQDQYKSNQSESALKKKQKKTKGHPVNLDLLGFTVQPDPNVPNRGEIEEL